MKYKEEGKGMDKEKLAARDAKRDIAEELLEAADEIAG